MGKTVSELLQSASTALHPDNPGRWPIGAMIQSGADAYADVPGSTTGLKPFIRLEKKQLERRIRYRVVTSINLTLAI